MNWEAIGAIGELVGALGVIATLSILAIQIKRGRDEFSRRSATDFVVRNNANLSKLADDPVLRDIHLRAIQDYGTLSESEQLAWEVWMGTWVQGFEQLLVDEAHGVVKGLSVDSRGGLVFLNSNPPFLGGLAAG
jgi:hypothetical protein